MTAAPIDEVVDLLRTLALAAHAVGGARAVGHREGATLGTRRGDARSVRRGARRSASVLGPGSAQSGRVPDRQDLRRVGRGLSSIPAPTQRALRTLEWVHRHENLVVCGPSGTGKTHFLEALGQACVEPRVRMTHRGGRVARDFLIAVVAGATELAIVTDLRMAWISKLVQ